MATYDFVPLPDNNYRKKGTDTIEQIQSKWSALLAWWYRLMAPTTISQEANLVEREAMRRQQLASVIILFVGMIAIAFLLPTLFSPSQRGFFPLITLIIDLAALLLNRQGKSFLAGLLVVTAIEATIFLVLLTTPGGLNTNSLPFFDLLVPATLIAALLLSTQSIFVVSLVNSIFIFADLTFQPHTADLGYQLIGGSAYFVYLRPMASQVIVALVIYFWASSVRQEMGRADRAEEITRLQQTIALQNEQRIDALYAEHMIGMGYAQQQQMNHLKDQLLLHVSHELLTPLTAISGYLDLLKELGKDLNSTAHALCLDHAREGCQELTLLVNTVQDALEIDGTHNRTLDKDIPVCQIVDEVLEHLDAQETDTHTFRMAISKSLAVRANRQSLYQVLRHLLSNACKYSPSQTEVLISATQTKENEICISILDKGPGIPTEDIPLLFEKFVRLRRDLTGSTRGMGLGLYMSKQLVKAMNGHIWIESSGQTEEGCRVCLTLPATIQTSFAYLSEKNTHKAEISLCQAS